MAPGLGAERLPEAVGDPIDGLVGIVVAPLVEGLGQKAGGQLVATLGQRDLDSAVGCPVQLGRPPGSGASPARKAPVLDLEKTVPGFSIVAWLPTGMSFDVLSGSERSVTLWGKSSWFDHVTVVAAFTSITAGANL